MQLRTVLVVSGGGFQGLALIKALRHLPSVRVLVADANAANVGMHFAAACFRTPMLRDTTGFEAFLLGLCESEQVGDLFPATSLELDVLCGLRAKLEAIGVTVHVSADAALRLADDKLRFHEWLVAHGLPSLPALDPLTTSPSAYPLFGRPRKGFGSKGTITLKSPEQGADLDTHQLQSFIWQPRLTGFDEYSVDFAINEAGVTSPLSIRCRRLASGGFAVICTHQAPPEVRAVGQRVVDLLPTLGARGVLNLQLLHADGECWVTDLNPRVGTSLPLSLAAGFNPVAFLFGEETSHVHDWPLRHTFRALQEFVVYDCEVHDVKGVVFDLDDTLLDQKDWIVRKLALTWEAHSSQLPQRAVFMRAGLEVLEEGKRSDLFDAMARELSLTKDMVHALIDTYRTAVPTGCRVYSDVRPVLLQLRRLGYTLALLTDNPARSQRQKLDVADLGKYFDAIVLTGDLGYTKPDPRPFAQAANLLGLPENQLSMVGDHLYKDIQGAGRAGFAQGFLIRRPAAMFAFNTALADVLDLGAHPVEIDDLHQLLWYFKGGFSERGGTAPCT